MKGLLVERPTAHGARTGKRTRAHQDVLPRTRGDSREDDLSVLVVADDPASRSELVGLLAGQPGCVVVGEAEGPADLPAAVEAARPDVVVWDPGWDLAAALEYLADAGDPRPPVVVLVSEEADSTDAVTAGVNGILRRDVDGPGLVAAVRAARAGLLVIDPALGAARTPLRDSASILLHETLTVRELEVLQLLTEGLSNKGIAERLKISENTAKFHVNAILGKLGAQNRTEAVTRAARAGLIIL